MNIKCQCLAYNEQILSKPLKKMHWMEDDLNIEEQKMNSTLTYICLLFLAFMWAKSSGKYQNKSHLQCSRRYPETSNLSIWTSDQSTHPPTHSSIFSQPSIRPSIHSWSIHPSSKHTYRYCRCPSPAKASSEIRENVFEFNSLCRTRREWQRWEFALSLSYRSQKHFRQRYCMCW